MGTGSGCIILSLLDKMPNARGVGLDICKKTFKNCQTECEKIIKKSIFKVKFFDTVQFKKF